MLSFLKTNWTGRLVTLVPAVIIVGLTLFIFFSQSEEAPSIQGSLPGEPLSVFEDLYPVRLDAAGNVTLDLDKFSKALVEVEKKQSPRAAADLIYFGQANNISLMLSDKDKASYGNFIRNHLYAESNAQRFQDQHFQPYRDIVNGIGQTFAGTGIEVVLHDMRNPLKAIIAIQNPISGRRVGDPTTNFGLRMIKNYSLVDHGQSSLVSYGLKLKDGRDVKSTTIPIYDRVYGMIGAICINIDITNLDPNKNPAEVAAFINLFKAIDPNEKIAEIIDSSTRTSPKN